MPKVGYMPLDAKIFSLSLITIVSDNYTLRLLAWTIIRWQYIPVNPHCFDVIYLSISPDLCSITPASTMRFSALIVLTASTLAVCQSPSSCKGGGKRNGADFVLTDQGINKHLGPLSKIFTNAKKRVNVSDVFDDGNHLMSGSATKLAWEKTKDFNDVDTKKWYPQGISSTADAAEVGTYDGKDGWVVSWYSDESHQVRISFVNKATKKYRHALLVYPSANDNFTGVGIHAGGIMWYGDTLWVVDTSNGIRVFDMSNIWEVGSGDKVGKVSAGKYSAAGYKYVIPQIRYGQTEPYWITSTEFN